MIRAVAETELMDCLEVFHRGYETVAVEIGLTEENCPDRGRAGLPYRKLLAEYEGGAMMFGYFVDGQLVGFLGMKMREDGVCKLDDIVVLPEYRGKGYGNALLDFCKGHARALGAGKVALGMIDDNRRLRKWYEDHGFVNVGYVNYEGAPFTVGRMECPV